MGGEGEEVGEEEVKEGRRRREEQRKRRREGRERDRQQREDMSRAGMQPNETPTGRIGRRGEDY